MTVSWANPVRGTIDRAVTTRNIAAGRDQLYAALPAPDGLRLCSAAYTGLAINTGTSWTCAPVENGFAVGPDLALAPDGTLHVAWSGTHGLGYANSLGSFLATNFDPQVSFGAPSSTASAAIVPTAITDADRDDLAGHIHVGRYQHVASLVEAGTTAPILHGHDTLMNADNSYLHDTGNRVQFRAIGGNPSWSFNLYRSELPALPAIIEVRYSSGETVGAFIAVAWDDTGVTISQIDFVPYVTLTHSGTLPSEIDISALPQGDTWLAVSALDGSTWGFAVQPFTKTAGQVRLLLTIP